MQFETEWRAADASSWQVADTEPVPKLNIASFFSVPRAFVDLALGVTAARAVVGRAVGIQRERGKIFSSTNPLLDSANILVTVHPSYLLRVPDEDKAQAYRQFVDDLQLAAGFLKAG